MEVSEGGHLAPEIAVPMKCRKCRFVLLIHPQVRIEDSHGHPFVFEQSPRTTVPEEDGNQKPCKSDVWYIPEDCMPGWMSNYVEKGEWVKGKVNCPNPKCDARIGSYDFVSGLRCPCKSQVVAPIHIVKSKVDFTTVPSVPKVHRGQDTISESNTLSDDHDIQIPVMEMDTMH